MHWLSKTYDSQKKNTFFRLKKKKKVIQNSSYLRHSFQIKLNFRLLNKKQVSSKPVVFEPSVILDVNQSRKILHKHKTMKLRSNVNVVVTAFIVKNIFYCFFFELCLYRANHFQMTKHALYTNWSHTIDIIFLFVFFLSLSIIEHGEWAMMIS